LSKKRKREKKEKYATAKSASHARGVSKRETKSRKQKAKSKKQKGNSPGRGLGRGEARLMFVALTPILWSGGRFGRRLSREPGARSGRRSTRTMRGLDDEPFLLSAFCFFRWHLECRNEHTMSVDADSSYSRITLANLQRAPKMLPKPTGIQKALEWTLFLVFGLTIALAGVALYAVNRPEHRAIPNRVSEGITADRVNILLIGSSLRTQQMGDAAVRIESLMLLSIQPSTGRAALMSIPVDLWVPIGRHGKRPLRAAHSVGDANGYPGGGTGLTVDTVEQIIDVPIHAYARFSIGDVQRLVDSLGGVDVDVKRGVYEYRSKLRFRPGSQHLSGARATRYAYSGAIAGLAASNRFAREERQQDVIVAALSKAIETHSDVASLQSVFGALTATNLSPSNIELLARALRRDDRVRRISFEPYLDTFDVTSVAYQGEAVRPRSGNFAALHIVADAALQ